ncbi:MAG: phosphocholine cytidylyltransferase family protein [Gammaproteobacteria bacterium]|nr:phosphocholine cytidylyltransferase family protein [Gammaproteobacteria bacterium]
MRAVTTAVILAAGMGTRLKAENHDRPKGFLKLGEKPIVEESISRLQEAGINSILIATGHCHDYYDALARESGGSIQTAYNASYRDSGSMYSLYCARELVQDDFLLLESDLIYEQRALTSLMHQPQSDCVLLSDATNSGDEVFVETRDDLLVAMSKDRSQLGSIAGELVGITRVSKRLFEIMIDIAEAAFRSTLHYDYETDCLVAAAKQHPVHCHLEGDLAWGEIDDASHLARARSSVYPQILARDASLLRQ